ncbi:hypothetical protein JL722_12364 [Aureococcus anophagefferens]|nr:hypothetical protein JL722_12364 [Aureococcus anophagefferens]
MSRGQARPRYQVAPRHGRPEDGAATTAAAARDRSPGRDDDGGEGGGAATAGGGRPRGRDDRGSRSPPPRDGAAAEETKDVGDAGGVGDRLDGALDRSLALRRGEAHRGRKGEHGRREPPPDAAGAEPHRVADGRPTTGRDAMKPSVFEARSIPFVLRKLHAFVLAPAPSGGGVVVRRGNRSRHYLGKLRANGATSEYTLFSAGDKPPAGAAGAGARRRAGDPPGARCEMAAVAFSSKRSAPTNPRRMEVAVPQTRWRPRNADDGPRHDDDLDDGVVAVASFRPARDQDSLCHTLNLAQGQGAQNVLHADRIAVLHMRESKYDPLSSCLLVKSSPVEDHMKKEYFAPGGEGARENPNPDAAQPIILQMGKVGKNCFNMDYQFPMSMLQAFATCIARFDTRVAT